MNASAIVLALCSLFFLSNAYPLLTMPQFPASKFEEQVKRNNQGFPLTDDDVLQLENLKRNENQKHYETEASTTTAIKVKSTAELLPDLEHQLELVKPNPTDDLTNQQEQAIHKAQEHKPSAETSTAGAVTIAGAPAIAKQYHGAARLAFGQNPEVLPTLSTPSTTLTTTSTTIMTIPTTTELSESKNDLIKIKNQSNIPISLVEAVVEAEEATLSNSDIGTNVSSQIEETLNEEIKLETKDTNTNIPPLSVGETAAFNFMETAKITARRSLSSPMSTKAAERLLQHRDGQYSAFDMAQYVFWTGDESGVARTVEELVDRGLMTHENALKFLREIRMGIEYLERSYANRAMPADLRQNHIKKTHTIHPRLLVAPSTTTEHMTIVTEKPIKAFLPLWHSSKPYDSAATWSKLQELNANEAVAETNDYDEASGRAKIAEFLYTEYTLEEILYKLAKVMFTQSLAHGSGEAQKELQKLTDFLEREGNLGVIPIDLQKKVLNTLLTALSDTLSENPELLPAARSNLGNIYSRYNKTDE